MEEEESKYLLKDRLPFVISLGAPKPGFSEGTPLDGGVFSQVD